MNTDTQSLSVTADQENRDVGDSQVLSSNQEWVPLKSWENIPFETQQSSKLSAPVD